jgi:hypothetical protein
MYLDDGLFVCSESRVPYSCPPLPLLATAHRTWNTCARPPPGIGAEADLRLIENVVTAIEDLGTEAAAGSSSRAGRNRSVMPVGRRADTVQRLIGVSVGLASVKRRG